MSEEYVVGGHLVTFRECSRDLFLDRRLSSQPIPTNISALSRAVGPIPADSVQECPPTSGSRTRPP